MPILKKGSREKRKGRERVDIHYTNNYSKKKKKKKLINEKDKLHKILMRQHMRNSTDNGTESRMIKKKRRRIKKKKTANNPGSIDAPKRNVTRFVFIFSHIPQLQTFKKSVYPFFLIFFFFCCFNFSLIYSSFLNHEQVNKSEIY